MGEKLHLEQTEKTAAQKNYKDCFAYGGRKCKALSVKICEDTVCSFYKTQEQYFLDQEKALDRIYSLDEKLQNHIFETYKLKDGREKA